MLARSKIKQATKIPAETPRIWADPPPPRLWGRDRGGGRPALLVGGLCSGWGARIRHRGRGRRCRRRARGRPVGVGARVEEVAAAAIWQGAVVLGPPLCFL
jgi:hypothetical protein